MPPDLQYAMFVFGAIAIGGILLLIGEWFSITPPDWVVKVRLWLHRRKK